LHSILGHETRCGYARYTFKERPNAGLTVFLLVALQSVIHCLLMWIAHFQTPFLEKTVWKESCRVALLGPRRGGVRLHIEDRPEFDAPTTCVEKGGGSNHAGFSKAAVK
jgi:hypothetical protein